MTNKKNQIENSIRDINNIYNKDVSSIIKRMEIIDALLLNLNSLTNGTSRVTFLNRTLEILLIICNTNKEYMRKLDIIIKDDIHYDENERREANEKYNYYDGYNNLLLIFSSSFYGNKMYKKLLENIK